MTDQEAQQLRESVKQKDTTIEQLETKLAEAQIYNEARTFVTAELAKSEMPSLVRDRLTESLSAKPVIADGALDKTAYTAVIEAAVKSEIEFAQKAYGYGSGEVQGNGSTVPAGGDETVIVGVSEARATIGLA